MEGVFGRFIEVDLFGAEGVLEERSWKVSTCVVLFLFGLGRGSYGKEVDFCRFKHIGILFVPGLFEDRTLLARILLRNGFHYPVLALLIPLGFAVPFLCFLLAATACQFRHDHDDVLDQFLPARYRPLRIVSRVLFLSGNCVVDFQFERNGGRWFFDEPDGYLKD